MSFVSKIDGNSQREIIDATQVYATLREAMQRQASYGGSMRFERRGAGEYLLRRPAGQRTHKSLGPRSDRTEQILEDWLQGRARNQSRITSLKEEVARRGRILIGHRVGRVPVITARILRKLDELQWLGRPLVVLGTNALYAYEARAGVHVRTDEVATGDVDILIDARARVAMASEDAPRGLLSALQTVDKTFERAAARTFTAANARGFMVDLVRVDDHQDIMRSGELRLSDDSRDITASVIPHSAWLPHVPKFEAMAIDERGIPVKIVTIDPRVFALHKAWLAERPDRDPLKRGRDAHQAVAAAEITINHLGLEFDDAALSSVPIQMRAYADRLIARVPKPSAHDWF